MRRSCHVKAAWLGHREKLGQRVSVRRVRKPHVRMVDEPVGDGGRSQLTGLRRPVQHYALDQAHELQGMARRERQVRALAPETRGVKRLQVAQAQGVEGDGGGLAQAPGSKRPPHVAVDADGGGLAQRPHGALLGEPVLEGQAVVLDGRLVKEEQGIR